MLDTQSQAMFDDILSRDQETLSIEEKRFLMARRDYFNDEQKKRYADMIKLHKAGKLVEEVEEVEEDENDLNTLSLPSLKEVAKEEGVDVKGLKSKKEFIVAIKAHREAE